jgi:hypothetical protein
LVAFFTKIKKFDWGKSKINQLANSIATLRGTQELKTIKVDIEKSK